jgi:glycosyltransferase involved in cell wall biosynthesis
MLINLSFLIAQPTGISIYAKNVLPYLKNLNPTLLTAYPEPDYNCYQISGKMNPDYGIKGHLRRLFWTQFQLPIIYHKFPTNLLFSPVPEAPLYAGCRAVVMAHDLIPLRFPKQGIGITNYFRYYIPQVLNQAQHIICNSQTTADDLMQFFGIKAAKITPIPLAYDAKIFRFLDLPTSNYFLYIGRHDYYKNVTRLIDAFALLPQRNNYQLWLVGASDPTNTPRLKNQVRELGLNDLIKFLDYLPGDELPRVINQAIALVFPSIWEGFGLPVLEAMACGTPVITSNLSSLPEVTGNASLLVDPYNVQAIAQAMHTVGNDAKARLSLRQQGLARASEFSWQRTGEATAAILQRYI